MQRKSKKERVERKTRFPVEREWQEDEAEYPLAAIAYYGPHDRLATKVSVGILMEKDGDFEVTQHWMSRSTDVRYDLMIAQQIREFMEEQGVKSVMITDRIVGCPHEEGVDYPAGERCPLCPFWADRDSWTGELIH